MNNVISITDGWFEYDDYLVVSYSPGTRAGWRVYHRGNQYRAVMDDFGNLVKVGP